MIEGFEQFDYTHGRKRHSVFKQGSGSPVILLHEIYGVSRELADLARIIANRGFTVYVPWLLGDVLKPVSSGYALRCIAQACISREFTVFATGKTSPIAAANTAKRSPVKPLMSYAVAKKPVSPE